MRPTPSDYWHLDEMVIVIRGRRHWLWRAVDNEGEVLDFLVQSIEAEHQGSVEIDAETTEETRMRANADHNR